MSLITGLSIGGGYTTGRAQTESSLTATTSDGVVIHGEAYYGGLDASAPLVLLFHQGGSSGRGEYTPLVPWLNAMGFRAIAWDLRAGGSLHGVVNRTVAGLGEGAGAEFCDAYADMQAALEVVHERKLATRVVVWGSSYSGSLVFRLAAEYPDRVAGVIAFSPSAGGPMLNCRARRWADRIAVPVAVFRPGTEMERESSREQRTALARAGADFRVVEDGVHGSSMLIDARTGHDMEVTRRAVIEWLDAVFGIGR